MKRLLHKNLNVIREYGVLGLPAIYTKAAKWHLLHYISSKKTRYRRVAVNGRPMLIDVSDRGISKALFIYGIREKDQMYIIEQYLTPGATVLDIGANIGYYVIFAAGVAGANADIIAYEPSESNCELLRMNVELNRLSQRVKIYNAAVSDKTGRSKFYVSEKSNLHTLNPLYYKGACKGEEQKARSSEVNCVDIYEIIGRHRDIRFVRMDIEGHEVEVLNGLAKAVRDFHVFPDILFETHFLKYDIRDHDMSEVLENLFDVGYRPKIMTSTDEKKTRIRERGYFPKFVINTDRVRRGIYEGVSPQDAVDFICNIGGVRAVFLTKD